MSTIFCYESIPHLIQSKRFSMLQYVRKGVDKLLTGPRVSKAGRPDLYRRSAYSLVIKHVFDRLDASEAYNWCFDGLLRFPSELQGNGFNGGAGQTPCRVAEAGLPGAEVDGHCRVSVCHC